ncbi:MAG: cache domain-containing protein [Phycisphaeraceae bacterium]|nr:cache domain-containing protein [Phycisphaeraceae bacterium]
MWRAFILKIVLPILLCAALFGVAIFSVLLPALEQSILDRKKEMIRELTHSAWNILANFEQQVREGRITRDQAQAQAIIQVQNLHYGPHMKDYFWINDMHPRMVVHPYRFDLNGKDLTDFADPSGKRLFVEAVELVRRKGSGYIHYQWNWKDDPSRIVPKLSFVKGFEPWGWIIGTGIYLDDVQEEIRGVTRRLVGWSVAILLAVASLLTLIAAVSWTAEKKRRLAEDALKQSEARYRTLVESAGASILMSLDDDKLYGNASACVMLGYSQEELAQLSFHDLLVTSTGEPAETSSDASPAEDQHEADLRRKDGSILHCMLACSDIHIGPRRGRIIVATDITSRKREQEALDQTHGQLLEDLGLSRRQEARLKTVVEELQLSLTMLRAGQEGGTGYRILDDLRDAATPRDIIRVNQALPTLVKSLVDSGVKAPLVNRLITLNTDAVVESLLRMALREMGPPPAPFVFLIMGSEGRREQTLHTDQDNALLFADVREEELDAAKAYFLALGRQVCDRLHDAGYARCNGQVMAMNPKWCQPLSAWKRHFSGWIRTLEADDLLQAKIFFDFRGGHGESALADELRRHLDAELAGHARFFAQLARNILLYVPPLGVFGHFQLEQTPDGRRALNIKAAMTPIVDFTRIYALRHGVKATNTLERLEHLRDLGVIQPLNHMEIQEVYLSLMQMRFATQVRALSEGRPPDNFIEPSHLTHLEQRILKESFSQVRHFQTRLAYDFTGMAQVPT